MIQEKLSTTWNVLSSMLNGLLVALPKLVRPFASPMFGMPQEFLSVICSGTPISLSTSSTPASCWPTLLKSELYPKRASFTLLGESMRVFESTHWLALV